MPRLAHRESNSPSCIFLPAKRINAIKNDLLTFDNELKPSS